MQTMQTIAARATVVFPTIVAGTALEVFVSGGWRKGRTLAVLGEMALIEYETPGYTALRILDLRTLESGEERDRPVSYWKLSSSWLQAIVEAGQPMLGRPVRRPKETGRLHGAGEVSVPLSPGALLQCRQQGGR